MATTTSIPTRSAGRTQETKYNNNNYYYYYIKKQAHNVHYHDGRRHGSEDESLTSCTSAVPSNDELSANKSGGDCTPENYHLDSFHIPKKRKALQEDSGLAMRNDDDAFNFKN
jgi:hypothetical protein